MKKFVESVVLDELVVVVFLERCRFEERGLLEQHSFGERGLGLVERLFDSDLFEKNG